MLLLPQAIGLACWALWPQARPVDVAVVQGAPVHVVVSEPARARLRDRYLIGAPLAGVVDELPLRVGDAITAGQVVARLSPAGAAVMAGRHHDEVQATLERAHRQQAQAEAEVASAEAERTRVRADAQRAEVLFAQRLVDRARVEEGHARVISADVALRAALARRDAAHAEVEAARAVMALQALPGGARQLVLAAPAAGVVLRREANPGDAVDAGQVLLEVGQLGAIEVLADLRSTHALHLVPGEPVRLGGWDGAGELDARVRRVEPGGFSVVEASGLREQRVTVVADLDPAAATRARLAEGSRLQAQFSIDPGAEAVGVPPAALQRDGARWAVYVVVAGRARLRHVELGPVGKDLAAVYAGLSAGERVVLAPDATLRDGLRVRARN